MNLVVHIPDDIAVRFGDNGDIGRQALEAFAVEAFRASKLTRPELRRMLGFGSRPALDAFLAAHGLFGTFTEDDLARDRQDLRGLGL